MDDEYFLPLNMVGANGLYEVSNRGTVRSLHPGPKRYGKILIQQRDRYGYRKASLRLNKKFRTVSVHRCVALTFIPNPENKPYVNHIDGDKANNHLSNLEWCTQSENLRHHYRVLGGLSHMEMFTDAEVIAIRERVSNGESMPLIAKELKVNHNTIYRLVRGKTYKPGRKVFQLKPNNALKPPIKEERDNDKTRNNITYQL